MSCSKKNTHWETSMVSHRRTTLLFCPIYLQAARAKLTNSYTKRSDTGAPHSPMLKKHKCLWRSEQHSRHREAVVMPIQPRAYGVLSPAHSLLDRAAVAEQDTCSRSCSAPGATRSTPPLWQSAGPFCAKPARLAETALNHRFPLSSQISYQHTWRTFTHSSPQSAGTGQRSPAIW